MRARELSAYLGATENRGSGNSGLSHGGSLGTCSNPAAILVRDTTGSFNLPCRMHFIRLALQRRDLTAGDSKVGRSLLLSASADEVESRSRVLTPARRHRTGRWQLPLVRGSRGAMTPAAFSRRTTLFLYTMYTRG